jgi:hypothetical protein
MKKIIHFVAVIILMMHTSLKVNAQASSTSHTYSTNDWIGWTSTGQNLQFGYGSGTPVYTMELIPGSGNGDLNLINGTTTPSVAHTNAYRIGGYRVLWTNDDNTSIYVGDGAGASTSASSTLNNTFVGNNAGTLNTSGADNTFIGYNAGAANTTADGNTAVGSNAGAAINTGEDNTFVGESSGAANTTAEGNTAIGYDALSSATTMGWNTAVGYKALAALNTSCIGCWNGNTLNTAVGYGALENTQAYGGTAIGFWAAQNNIDGCSIIAIGEESARYNNDANNNIAIGLSALHDTYNAGNNVALGNYALVAQNYTSAVRETDNVAIGHSALNATSATSTSDGEKNTALGNLAGYSNETGSRNLFLGYSADAGSNNLNNAAAIGANAKVMDNNNMILGDDAVRVGIGLSNVSGGVKAKLDVKSETPDANGILDIAGNFLEKGTYTSTTPRDMVAVKGKSEVTRTLGGKGDNIGGDFQAKNAERFDIGVRGTADGTKNSVGLWANASNGTSNLGVVTQVTVPTTANLNNIGVYSDVGPTGMIPTGYIGVYGAVPTPGTGSMAIFGDLGLAAPPCAVLPCAPSGDFAGYFNGDVLSTTGNYLASDENLKTDIEDITDPMEIINQLNPKSYLFAQADNPSIRLANGTHFGFLAQELETVIPELVKDCVHPARYNFDGELTHEAVNFKAINYTELIPLLLAGMKQQQAQIAELLSRQNHPANNGNEEELQENNSEQNSEQATVIDVTLQSKAIVLNPASPNPFKESTSITFFIPEGTKNVKMIFTDSQANILKEVDIPQTGKGEIKVYAQDLSTGIYTYTLVADGVTIDSKKMVCTK